MASISLGGVTITNPSKVFWPDEGYTKRDLAQFYRRIARFILPWMKSRVLTMERCPEGVRKSCFFQKQAPKNLPSGVPTIRLPAPSAGRDVDYIVGGSLKTLLTLVNLGCIAMHVTNSRIDALESPDWMAFDLDPATDTADAADVAVRLRGLLEDHGLESFVKTSGGRGLHLFVPLRRGSTEDQVRQYASAIARELADAYPQLATVESRKAKRRASVFIDVMRNAARQTVVPPYAVRWRPHAPVSMPLAWTEVTRRLDPTVFTIRSAERRLATRAPWDDFFRKRQTLPRL